MTKIDDKTLNELSDFIHDAMLGHYPESSNFIDDMNHFMGDFDIVKGKPSWVRSEPDSDPMVKHELLEEYAWSDGSLSPHDTSFYSFVDCKHAIPVKNSDYWVVFEGDSYSPISKYAMGMSDIVDQN